jgi:hypothetical protein
MLKRFLEDFAVGQVYKTGRVRVEKDEIFAFARQFGPQTLSCRRGRRAGIAVSRPGGKRVAYGSNDHAASGRR